MATRIYTAEGQVLLPGHVYLDLDVPDVQAAALSLPTVIENLPHDLEHLRPVVQQLRSALRDKYIFPMDKVYEAHDLGVADAVDMLAIDYDENSIDHFWDLSPDEVALEGETDMSPWAREAIETIKRSRSFDRHHPRSFASTLVDILLCDRLAASDATGYKRPLYISSEVSIQASVRKTKKYGDGYVLGYADKALGTEKAELSAMLFVIDAKKGTFSSSTISRMLCHLAGVQDARKSAGKPDSDVFGMTTDFVNFQFVVLRNDRRAYTSEPLSWVRKRDMVVGFIDHILRKAIESSPFTAPVKVVNKHIRRKSEPAGSFMFGASEESDAGDEADHYEVVVVDGRSVLRRSSLSAPKATT